MNFHSTTAPRIRETPSTCTMKHIATLYYSDTNRAVGDDNAVVVDENVEVIHHEMHMLYLRIRKSESFNV